MPARSEFDQDNYLLLHPDVSDAIAAGIVGSAWQHFTLHGFAEGRAWTGKPNPLLGVDLQIAPGDDMYRENPEHYFDVGASAMRCVESALVAANRLKSSVHRILDLPCGYGRVMRFLKRNFPKAGLTACDLNTEGVDFCAKTFGAAGVRSAAQPREIALDGDFDLIWCGSLLTHLSRSKCAEFIGLFRERLAPGGLLVFTMHGRRCEIELATGKNRCGLDDAQIGQLLREYRRTGFGYVDYRNEPGYGISIARPAFVISEFAQHPEWQLIGYRENGWDYRQDVIALQKLSTQGALRIP